MIGASLAALDRRQPLLTRFGLLLLGLSLVTAMLQWVDPRLFMGQPTWAKPTRFLLSVGFFASTAAWFIGDVCEDLRQGRLLRATAWALVATGAYEVFYIAYRAALGQASHFNFDTPWTALGYALMGIGAVVLVATSLPIAWRVWHQPRPGLSPHYRLAVVMGLVLTVLLGGVLGGYMSATGAHDVGARGGTLAMTGWNRTGGDLRVAHFLGLHASQILPVAAIVIGVVLPRGRQMAVAVVAALVVAATLFAFTQAVSGRPFLPSIG
ncbi:hypothetical protein [Sphingomonas sp. AX6]|uniref:hypothetical protein n=1 Tax=Sphingomonas sp. AX6 TaxID=2653171 RepID=UPI0012F3ED64|nr:hypothetical protein [Sphingomonas sp. AX6]VXC87249.1 conserved membrane hypothetical protein [Sphingomonas sp. AX6]